MAVEFFIAIRKHFPLQDWLVEFLNSARQIYSITRHNLNPILSQNQISKDDILNKMFRVFKQPELTICGNILPYKNLNYKA